MPDNDLSRVAVEAMRLQNGYALAIDARDWELFRDRLREDSGTWRIARRKLRMLSVQPGAQAPAGYRLVQSVLDLADWT